IRSRLTGHFSFYQLLASVKSTVRSAFEHRDALNSAPAGWTEESQTDRVVTRVALSIEPSFSTEELERQVTGTWSGANAGFELLLHLFESADGISGELMYDAEV